MKHDQEQRHQMVSDTKSQLKYDDFEGFASNKKQAYGFAGLILLLLSYFAY